MSTRFRNRVSLTILLAWALGVSVLLAGLPPVVGQDASQSAPPEPVPLEPEVFEAPSAAADPATKAEVDPATKAMMVEFDKRLTLWAEAIVDMREAQIRFHNGDAASEEEFRQLARTHHEAGRQRYDDVLEQAIKMLEQAPTETSFLKPFVAKTVEHRGHVDWYEGLAKPAVMLGEYLQQQATPAFHSVAARALIVAGNFDEARGHLEKALQREERLDCDLRLISTLDALAAEWKAEQERLAKDPDDLPLVEFATTRGRIVMELYEDQAPNTVANFIRLVEDGFYDGLPFHQVIDHLFAMTGDPFGDGTGTSGHRIPDEADHPDARSALYGSLMMAKLQVPGDPSGKTIADSASSQLMIMLLPMAIEDSGYTVFGRVIEGMPAISYLTRIDPSKPAEKNAISMPPDRILSATVLRKRDHAYDPQFVE